MLESRSGEEADRELERLSSELKDQVRRARLRLGRQLIVALEGRSFEPKLVVLRRQDSRSQ